MDEKQKNKRHIKKKDKHVQKKKFKKNKKKFMDTRSKLREVKKEKDVYRKLALFSERFGHKVHADEFQILKQIVAKILS